MSAAKSASLLDAIMNALQGVFDTAAAKSKGVQRQLKEGRYDKKKHEGKANGTDLDEEI